jgi:hypothetical protein
MAREGSEENPYVKTAGMRTRGRGSWQVELAAHVNRLHYILQWVQSRSEVPASSDLAMAISANLELARDRLGRRPSPVHLTEILAHLDAAQTDLLRLAPPSYVYGALPDILARAKSILSADDFRMAKLETLLSEGNSRGIGDDERQLIVATAQVINEQDRHGRLRLETFRRVVLTTAGITILLAVSAALLGFARPTLFPVCFTTAEGDVARLACPAASSPLFSGQFTGDINEAVAGTAQSIDVVFLEFLGLFGAALSTSVAIKNLRGSRDPYNVSVALINLKLATGALIALFGMILINAGLVPGIETFDSSAEIIAWALVLGYSQQLFTGVIDRRAADILQQGEPGAALAGTGKPARELP